MAGIFDTIVNGLTGGLAGDAEQGASDLFAPVSAFFGTVTDGKMWRSLGWILLGLVCLNWGVVLLLREPIEKGIGAAAKVAAL